MADGQVVPWSFEKLWLETYLPRDVSCCFDNQRSKVIFNVLLTFL